MPANNHKFYFFPFTVVLAVAIFFRPINAALSAKSDVYKQARIAMEHNQFQQAALLLQNMLAKNPDDTEAIALLEKAFHLKIERQRIETKLQHYIDQKNIIAAKAQLRVMRSKDPYNQNLDKYKKYIDRMEQVHKFSADRLNLAKKQKAKRDELLKQGNQALQDKKYQKALLLFQQILKFAPGDMTAKEGLRSAQKGIQQKQIELRIKSLYQQAQNQYKRNQLRIALQTTKELLRIAPKHKPGFELQQKIMAKLRADRDKKSIVMQAQSLYNEGISYLNKEKYDKAINAFQDVQSLISDFKDTDEKIAYAKKKKQEQHLARERQKAEKIADYIRDGMAAYYAEDYQGAIANLSKAIEIDPENNQAQRMLQRSREALNIKSQEQVDENSPFFALVQTIAQKARAFYNQKKYRLAKQTWNEILLLFPKNKMALQGSLRCDRQLAPDIFRSAAKRVIEEGKILLNKKSYKQARDKFMIIADIDPNFAGIQDLLARTQTRQKQSQKATLPPATLKAYYNRAVQYYRQEKYKQAIVYFQKVVDNDPMNFQAAANLARVRKMISINPNAAPAKTTNLSATQKSKVRQYYILGLTRYSNNQYQAAIQAWKQVLRIDPNHTKAKANIRRVQRMLQS